MSEEIVKNQNKRKKNKVPTAERTMSTVLDDASLKERITVEGFRRGFRSPSASLNKIIELGLPAFLDLPVIPSRSDLS